MQAKEAIQQQIIEMIENVKETTPLVGSITNFVTIDFVANAQLASGGSAAMVYFGEEASALAEAGRGFYINLGTLLDVHEDGVISAAQAAFNTNTPWVLDPVGIGIGTLRANLLSKIKACNPTIIRCNASEAIALAQLWQLDTQGAVSEVKGVDSIDTVDDARAAAVSLARHTGGAVAVSGEVDLITDGESVAFSSGGSALMEKVTGFGCSLGGVAAVYAAAGSPFIAALGAANAYNLAATRAASKTNGPASFKVAFIDELYNVSAVDIAGNPFTIEEA